MLAMANGRGVYCYGKLIALLDSTFSFSVIFTFSFSSSIHFLQWPEASRQHGSCSGDFL
jgi:hypothetical protein